MIASNHQSQLDILDEIPYERFSNLEEEEIASRVRNIVGVHVRAHQDQDQGQGHEQNQEQQIPERVS
ncbi:MAG: hypothetical protein GY737_18655 [Desulfobacteraceae bacterium]|nr:hypothetical protein [Desulfobacteraceae bacterium]